MCAAIVPVTLRGAMPHPDHQRASNTAPRRVCGATRRSSVLHTIQCAAAIALTVMACGGDAGLGTASSTPALDNTPHAIALNPSAGVSLQSGATTTIVATVTNTSGTSVAATVSWSSSDPAVAAVIGGVVTGARVGTATISATTGALTASVSVFVTPGAGSQLAIRTQPQGAIAGSVFATQPIIEIRDAAGNLVTSSAASVTVAIASGGGTLVGASTVSAVAGLATFSGLVISGATGPRTLVFTAAGLTSATSNSFTVGVSTVPTTLAIAPTSGVTGTVVNVTLTGTNFVAGATAVVVAGGGVAVGVVSVVSPTTLTTTLTIDASAFIGARSVTVTTAVSTSNAQTFTINPSLPSPNPWPAPAYRGITGKGVIIAILDRGIQWQHPDFIKPDGTTRIKAMLDMSGQSYCASNNPAPIEYSEAQINAALGGGTALKMRDAVGHGTTTAGVATGNGRAAAGGRFAGVAPEADLIIVKLTSDGAPAHDSVAAENFFVGCYAQALDWLDQKATTLGEPMAALINSGVLLWGPTDGTSALSRKIDQVFGSRPGRIFVSPSGDEGALPTHAGGSYSNASVTVNLRRSSATASQLALWYTGTQPAQVTLVFDDGASVGPVTPGQSINTSGVSIIQYSPGQEFYPATSTSGDRFVSISITGHATTGRLILQGTGTGAGRFDLYADVTAETSFDDHLVAGRLTDQSSTRSAIVVGASVNASTYLDVDGIQRQLVGDVAGHLWSGSAGGPTRDGRTGIDVAAPGETVFAAFATNSYWGTQRFNMIKDGAGFYGRHGATSGAAPIVLGTAALMLQLRPTLTSDEARTLIHSTALSDAVTGTTPNNDWGFGRINIPALIDQLAPSGAVRDPASQTRRRKP